MMMRRWTCDNRLVGVGVRARSTGIELSERDVSHGATVRYGQSAGVAETMALSKGVAVQDVHVLELQAELIKAKNGYVSM